MKKFTIMFTTSLLLAATSSFPSDKGNGGFLYSRTSKKILDAAQSSLLTELKTRSTRGMPKLYESTLCPRSIDLAELENQIQNLSYTYTESSLGINPDGVEEPRFFDTKDGRVRATKDFFESFVESYFLYEDGDQNVKDAILKRVRTPIIHEVIHDFGYDEPLARVCAPEVESMLAFSDARKLAAFKLLEKKKLNTQIQRYLEKYCADDVKDAISKDYARSEGVARKLLACAAEHDSLLKKENPNKPTRETVDQLTSLISRSLTREELADFLNGEIRFSFESEETSP